MSMYNRVPSIGYRTIDRWEGGVGWLAYPDETGQRVSHAIVGDSGGVWLIDPLDAPGVDDLFTELGDVVGVAILSNYHARDADVFAERHDVPVYLPRWMGRVEERIEAPVERYTSALGDSGFHIRKCSPLPGWHEALAYRNSDRTLYVADVLGTAAGATVREERIGVYLLARLFPPLAVGEYTPERILVGHGTGVFKNAASELADALTGAHRRFPAALLASGKEQLHALVAAFRD